MQKRFLSIWFRHLLTDQMSIRQVGLRDIPFVLAAPERGRMVVKAVNMLAEKSGIQEGMVLADARALLPSLEVLDDEPGRGDRLLLALAERCIRYSPLVAVDSPHGLLLDITGCPHLWGGERAYLKELITRLRAHGYDVRGAIADTIGAAWAVARYGQVTPIIAEGQQADALLSLPPASLRLEADTVARMSKLGFYQIRHFIHMPRSVLRRRFGQLLLDRLNQALGPSNEVLSPVHPLEPYQERLPCMEPIVTAAGIKIALTRLLEMLCRRLISEGKGVRTVVFKGYRVDGEMVQIGIGTNGPSCHVTHLFKLFELKIPLFEPAMGVELFVLDATKVEELPQVQESLWESDESRSDTDILELLDRLAGRAGMAAIHRYLPAEHYWPERSVREATTLQEKPDTAWRTDRPRPIHLLSDPELITVSAPVPDYPPMLFRYKGEVHQIKKAEGPERIEQEWWMQQGLHRDYYTVEDEQGARYWIFRLGHYDGHKPEWFLHGFFA